MIIPIVTNKCKEELSKYSLLIRQGWGWFYILKMRRTFLHKCKKDSDPKPSLRQIKTAPDWVLFLFAKG